MSERKRPDVGEYGLDRSDLPPIDGGFIDPRTWFACPDHPFEIEIGSGKGTFLVQQAPLRPDTNFLGIEWAAEYYRLAADRMRRHGLRNVRMLHDDATEFIRWRVPDGIVDVVHLYFADPWPKKRHHKRRSVQDQFLIDCHRILVPGGELRVVTDHADYWAWMQEHFDRHCDRFEQLPFERPGAAGEGEVVGTNFERKYRREGRPFNAITLRRNALGE
jgi:tRNA (guanine-N7-)-methyltransferase